MEKLIKYIGYVDYVGAVASLGWGAVHQSTLWLGFGLLGLLFAWWSPAKRINKLAQRKLLGRRQVSAAPDDAPLSYVPLQGPVEVPRPYYGYRTDLPYPRGVKVFRFKGADSFLAYAMYVGSRFGTKRQ